MISFLSTIFIAVFILQPMEWIGIFVGVPVQEMLLLLIVTLTIVTKPNLIGEFFRLRTTQLFVAYIFLSWISYFLIGLGASIFLDEHAPILMRYFLSYMIVVIGIKSIPNIRFALYIAMLSACVISLLLIRLKLTGVGVGAGSAQELNWRGGVQWLGQLNGSNTTAFILVTIAGMSLTFLSKSEKTFTRLSALFCLMSIILAILYTGSRGGMLGLIGVIGFYCMIIFNISYKKAIPLGLILLVGLLVLKPTTDDRGFRDGSSDERVELLVHGLEMLKENPFIGVGYKQFPRNNPVRKVAHNIYLEKVAENGIIGATFFFFMFYIAVRNSKKYYDENIDNTAVRNTTLGVWCSSVGLAICTFFLSGSHYLPYIILGLIACLPGNQAFKYKISTSEVRLVLGIEILSIALVYTAVNLYTKMFF